MPEYYVDIQLLSDVPVNTFFFNVDDKYDDKRSFFVDRVITS